MSFLSNPFEEFPELRNIELDEIMSAEVGDLPLFNLIKKLKFPDTDKKYFTLKVNKELKTPIQQYLLFFKDYVAGAKKKKIRFEVREESDDTLLLVTNGSNEISIEEMQGYFEEYVELTRQNMDKWVMKVDDSVSPMDADILRLQLENEIGRFRNAYKIARIRNKDLKKQNETLEQLLIGFSQKPTIININTQSEEVDLIKLLMDLIDKAVRMMERKSTKKIEDLHNDSLTDFLRDKGYNASDQTRSGKAKLTAGEVDIMIRKQNGTPVSVIEAFRLDSCGEKNTVISSHLDKLLHDYDTAGHEINFVIVYAEAQNFEDLWQNYQKYILQLGAKPEFRNEYPLLNFQELPGVSKKKGVKVGIAHHQRGDGTVQVYHIFIDMYVA
ncbi:MAG: hypothetical protein MUE85_09185 [Microscillaceae bacterium]|nr:hypothetical protein [Microscillaceae bacterium]